MAPNHVASSFLPKAASHPAMVLNASDLLSLTLQHGQTWRLDHPFPEMRPRQAPEFLALQDWIRITVLTCFSFRVVPGDISTPMAPLSILMGSQADFLMAPLSTKCLRIPPEAPLNL